MTTTISRQKQLISLTMKAFGIDKMTKSDRTGLHSRLGCLKVGIDTNGSQNSQHVDTPTSSRLSYRTPMYFIHTQTGSIPHISEEVLRLIYPSSSSNSDTLGNGYIPPLQISIDSTYKFAKVLEKYGKGIGKFVGLPGIPTFLTVHDSLFPLRRGYNDKFGVALWSRHGRTSISPQDFTNVLKTYKVDFAQVISDYDVDPGTSGAKRLKKSLSRVEEYTSEVINKKVDGCYIQTGIFITVEAAWFQMDAELAQKTVTKLLESQHGIEGILISGLSHRFEKGKSKSTESDSGNKKHVEKDRLNICKELDLELIKKIVEVLPNNLPKFVTGPFKLTQMLDLISRGIDIFESSVASRMADSAQVFILDRLEDLLPKLCKTVTAMNGLNQETLPVRNENDGSMDQTEESALVSLEEKRFFDDFKPISKTCTCYTCRKHTRSYVHHLFATEELLGHVLVQIHNLTALDRFFKIVRGIIEDSESPEVLYERLQLAREALSETEAIEIEETPEKIPTSAIGNV